MAGMTTSTHRSTLTHAAVLSTAALALGLIPSSPASAERPDDGCQVVTSTATSDDVGLVVAFRKAAAAQYAVDHAAELLANR
jgi:hypothetical protein